MYKYFGRLSGSTQAGQVLASSSPVNANTPFDPLVPATKFIAYGEDANSVTYNRAFSALSANTDNISSVLDSPALRYEILEPAQSNYGSTALTGLASTDVVVALGAGQQRPVSWVFVGLHQSKLGDFLQLERVGDDAVNQLITPSDVRETAASSSYFADVTYPGSAGLHGVPTRLVGVRPIQTSLPPYAGQALAVPVASWDSDGCYLDVAAQGGYSWKALYLQPGCFVYASGGAGENSGLYRIASVAGGTTNATAKAVLTNAFTKVKIAKVNQAEDVTINFPVGSMVSWRSRPSQSQGEADRTHRAYIMYVEQPALSTDAYLYLGTFSGGTDFAVQGSTSFKATPNVQGTETFNQFGLVELEAGANQNANVAWTTPPGGGTVLHNHTSTATKEVVAVTPAGAPVAFARGTFNPAYSIIPCSPPGFLLNPAVVLGGESTAIGGTFQAHCHVLTTVRDNLLSGGLSATRGSAAQGSSLFGPGYRASLNRLLRWIHVGDTADATNQPNKGTVLSTEFGQTRQVLGHALYTVVFANAPANLQVGTEVVFQSGPDPKTRAVVAAVQGTRLVFKDVVSLVETDAGQQDPILIGYGLVGQAINVTVSSVLRPQMLFRTWGGGLTPYTPTEGLDAAYHADYSSNPYMRGRRGLGNRVYAAIARPLTVVLPSMSAQAAFQAESSRRSPGQDYTVIRSGPVGMASTDMALEVVGGTVLRIKDGNATLGVLFSGQADTALNMTYIPNQNLIGAVNLGITNLRSMDQLFSKVLLSGATPTWSGLQVNIAAAEFIGTNGVHRAVLATSVLMPSGGGLVTHVVRWDGSAYVNNADAPATGDVPIALVSSNGTTVTSLIDLRHLAGNIDQKLDLQVGGYGAHFATLGEAVRFISNISNAGPDYQDRRWRILVRGPTTETGTVQFKTNQKGLVIEGFGEGATISWGDGFDTLFDLNGADDLVFRNLHLKYDDSSAPLATSVTQRRVFYNVGSTSRNVLIEGVRTEAAQSRLSCYGHMQDVKNLTIRDCRFEGATDVGFLFTNGGLGTECEGLSMTRVHVESQDTPQDPPNGASHYGIKLKGCREGVRLTDCRVEDWTYCGVLVEDCIDDVVFRGVSVTQIAQAGLSSDPIGIYLRDTSNVANRHIVEGCDVSSVIGTDGTGILCSVPGSLLSGNTVAFAQTTVSFTGYSVTADKVRLIGNIYQKMPFPAGSELGIYVTSDHCIVMGNQTGILGGLTITTPANNTDVANRDDP